MAFLLCRHSRYSLNNTELSLSIVTNILVERPVRRQEYSSDLRVIKIDPLNDARWQAFVCAHPHGSVYHHPAWIQALTAEYGQPAEHLACEGSNGEFLAILPLLRTRGLPFRLGGPLRGARLASLPRTPIAGPLSLDKSAMAAVVTEALRLAQVKPRVSLQIKTSSQELDGLVDGLVSTPWRLSYILQLPGESSTPFRILDAKERSKVRWAVNKAAKVGVTVRLAETERDLRGWYRIYLHTVRRSMVPPRSFRFFAAIWNSFRGTGMMDLLVAEYGPPAHRKIIAGSILLFFGKTASYSFSAMDRNYASLCANDALLWQAINTASERGFHFFDFGEVPDSHIELAKFKMKWGAQPHRLYRYYSPAPRQVPAQDHSEGMSLAAAAWRCLPPKITEWIGDQVYRFL